MADTTKIAVILTAIDKMSAIVDNAVSKSQSKLQKFTARTNELSKSAFTTGKNLAAAGLAVGAPIVGAIKQASQFENKLVNIRKQMEFDTPAAVKVMTADIMKLSRELPLATGEIQDMIAESLKMGIAQSEVIDFTKEITKMSVAFDTAPGIIAASMGKIANVYKIPIQQIGGFADVINYLDDQTQATGPEIIDVLQKVGGTAKYFKTNEIAALASTMVSLGETSETAGTAINAMVNRLGAATMQPKRFAAGLQMIGINAANLQKQMSDKATARNAITDIFDRINQIDPSKQNEVLVRLFGIEHGPKLAKLTNNVEMFRKQIELVQGQEKGSMSAEYAKRLETLNSAWIKAKNRIAEVAVTLGTTLLPAAKNTLIRFGEIAEKVTGFISRNPQLIASIGKAAALFAGLSLTGSATAFMFGGIFKGISTVSKGLEYGSKAVKLFTGFLPNMRNAILFTYIRFLQFSTFLRARFIPAIISTASTLSGTFVKAIRVVGSTFVWLGRALLTNPIILIITAIAAAALLIIKYWDPISKFFTKVWDQVKMVFKNSVDSITAKIETLKQSFTKIWQNIKTSFSSAIAFIGKILLNFTPQGLIIKHWEPISGIFKTIWNGVKNVFTSVWQWLINFGKRFYNAGANIVNNIIAGITSKITAITNTIKKVAQDIRGYFPFSPAKVGPLRDIHRIRLIETIAESINPTTIAQKMHTVANLALKPFIDINPSFVAMPQIAPVNALKAIPALTPISGPAEMKTLNGKNSNAGQPAPAINNTFNIHLSGKATKEDGKMIASELERRFKKLMDNYNSHRTRVSF